MCVIIVYFAQHSNRSPFSNPLIASNERYRDGDLSKLKTELVKRVRTAMTLPFAFDM